MSAKSLNEPSLGYSSEAEPVTPYLLAKEEWDNRIGNARVQAANWRIAALLAIILCIVLAGGLIYKSAQSTVTPYVVQVGADGAVQAVGSVKEMKYAPQEPELKYFLAQFVQKTRSLPLDPVVARQNWISAYDFMHQQSSAYNKMTNIVKTENSLAKVGQETVQINIQSIVALSNDTYQVRWSETVYGTDGKQKETYRMTGNFQIDFSPPNKEKEIIANPLGLFIKDFYWSRDI